MTPCLRRLLCVVALLWWGCAGAMPAPTLRPAVPDAYQMIAREQGIPPEILYAVSLAESAAKLQSGKVRPWPWTLNIAGEPRRFGSRIEAHNALRQAIAQNKLVDIGLGQVNWQYHRDSLMNDPWLAFEPYFNLRVAAKLLRDHYDATGRQDWWAAVGKYHSPGSKPAQRDRARRYAATVRARYEQLMRSGV